jgi:hypothetical protein
MIVEPSQQRKQSDVPFARNREKPAAHRSIDTMARCDFKISGRRSAAPYWFMTRSGHLFLGIHALILLKNFFFA